MLLLLALSRPDPRPMRTPMVHMQRQIRVRAAGVFRRVGVGAVVTLLCRYPGCILRPSLDTAKNPKLYKILRHIES